VGCVRATNQTLKVENQIRKSLGLLILVENQGPCALWSTFKWGLNFQSFKEAGAFIENTSIEASFQQSLRLSVLPRRAASKFVQYPKRGQAQFWPSQYRISHNFPLHSIIVKISGKLDLLFSYHAKTFKEFRAFR
jgi:hypothetical protein